MMQQTLNVQVHSIMMSLALPQVSPVITVIHDGKIVSMMETLVRVMTVAVTQQIANWEY